MNAVQVIVGTVLSRYKMWKRELDGKSGRPEGRAVNRYGNPRM